MMKTSLPIACALLVACTAPEHDDTPSTQPAELLQPADPAIYAPFALTTDLSVLNANEKQMLPLLIEAARIMDTLFWAEAWGRQDSLPPGDLTADQRRFFELNYGPWDRMNGNAPFIDGVGDKPKGANFYPADMTQEEFDALTDTSKNDPYTVLRRDAKGALKVVPYHAHFNARTERAASLLLKAADLATDPAQQKYLKLRSAALLKDDYQESDIAWLDMKNNTLDVIIGPIENYEDHFLGVKTSHSSYIVVKDKSWTKRLERFAKLLPKLQEGLPVEAAYKAEKPGTDSQLGAYDVIYYAGDCNAGGKTIAVNLPNDEEVQLAKGTRRLQFKNAMRAKFDRIMVPISNELIHADQRQHVKFDAFFENTMFHEVAHGLGIKHTINGKGTVREALKEEASALEEGKADILGLYMVTELRRMKEITEGELMDNYVTFLAGIFRSVRFGASSAHGRANMLRFNYFAEQGAFTRDQATGSYYVDPVQMSAAVSSLADMILVLQGNGDLAGVKQLMEQKGAVGADLKADLDRLSKASIPVDVYFEQGLSTLGL